VHFYSPSTGSLRCLMVAAVMTALFSTGCGTSNWAASPKAKAPTVTEVAASIAAANGASSTAATSNTSSTSSPSVTTTAAASSTSTVAATTAAAPSSTSTAAVTTAAAPSTTGSAAAVTSSSAVTTATPAVPDASAAATSYSTSIPPVLLFIGTGTSSGDVSAVEALLNSMSLRYATATSSQLNGMTVAALRNYKLLLVPGGNSITIGRNLTTTTTANIHNAVSNGMHYLGICAGGFFGGYSMYNAVNFTSGVWYNFYADYFRGIYKAAVLITSPNGTKLDQYWEDGPQLTGWGSIVAKYPDGTPAIVEGKFGNGFVILTGIHPEAPASWRYGMTFTSSVAADNAYAKSLVTAALNGAYLPHF
jgi:glutamine amidotransferase-like uncharacterized protein